MCKTVDISDDIVNEICSSLNIGYCHSNYVVFRKKENIDELFCISGSDIINADNIVSQMNNKKDGYLYYFSEEVTLFN